jgi:hypothetical protein
MHMNSAPHLFPEDRLEFERVLGEALRTAHGRPEPAATGQRLNVEQLRTMALAATATISSCAAAEYEHYVKVRTEWRAASSTDGSATSGTTGGTTDEAADRRAGAADGFTTAMGKAAESSGAGLAAVLSVLAPVLAGTAAAIFLLVGYVLQLLSPDEPVAEQMISVGWIFSALAVLGVVVAMGGLLLTALRNSGRSIRAAATVEQQSEEVAQAREAWRQALLERGVIPFLRDALTGPGAAPARTARGGDGALGPYGDDRDLVGRTPRLGYTRPGFSSPAAQDGADRSRPSFSSPDYTSPDYGGPDHEPD